MFDALEVNVSWLPLEAPELEVIDAKGVLKLTWLAAASLLFEESVSAEEEGWVV